MNVQDTATSGTDEFARIADAAPVPMWVTALDRRRLFVNRAYADFLGCAVADALDFDWRTVLHADDAARVVAESVAGEASLRPFALEARYRRADGEWRWLRSVSQPRFDVAGAHIGFIGVAHDVTAAKSAELELREREAQLSAFIEQTDAGFGQVDLTGRFTLVNDRFCRIVGRTRADLLQRTMQEITHPDDLPHNLPKFDAAVRGGRPYSLDKRYVRPDGSWVWVNNSVSVIRRPDGEPYGVLAVTVDVTARREAEAAVRANEARLAFLDALGNRTATAVDADAVLAITARMLGEHLKLSDCAYADMEPDEDTFHIRGDWHAPDAPSIAGTYSLSTFGSLAVTNLRAGRPLVVNDTIAELGDDGAKAFVGIDIRATICMPLVKRDRLTALMAIHAAEPRTWTDAELALLREVTERSWAHIERVRAQAALRESDGRLRLAIEGARIGTWEWDLRGGPSGTWSPRTCEIMGVGADVVVTPELRIALIHPEDRGWIPAVVSRLRESGGGDEFSNEYRIVRPDGEVRWLASRGVVIRDVDGEAVRMTGTIRDVTVRRTAQDSLAALNRTLEQQIADRTAERDRMWRLSGDLFVVVGARREVRAVNPAVAALGYDPADVIGRTLDAFIHPDDRRDVDAMIYRAARRSIGEFAARVRAASGEWRCFSWSAAPGEGEAYVIGRDITADVERRDELEQAREALRQSQKVESLGQLTGGVAHDFNNLLTPIIGNLDLLQRVPLGDGSRIRRLAGAALESAERARTLVQRLLAFARRQPLRPCPVDLAALVHGMAGLIASTSGPRVSVAIDAPAGLPPALADVNQIEMAILNLSVNARDAMPDGGMLTLKVERAAADEPDLTPGDYLRLSVSDSGVGMDEETRARAIEPFFSTKGLGKGTGLGLSMVHGLASQLGGRMTLDSRPGLGTTIALLLPVAKDGHAVAEDTVEGRKPARGAGAVLLVDDDVPVRRTTAEMLGDLGFRVTEAGSAEEALSILGDTRPDYLVTDHVMPGMTGAELAHAAGRIYAGLPILVVSGYAELESIPADLARLAKPFRVDELAACMKALA